MSLLAQKQQAADEEEKAKIQRELDSFSEEEMREALKEEDTPEEGLFDNNNRIDQEPKKIRLRKEEGGSMLVPPEMPVDTFTPEEQANAEESQLPDDDMEEDYNVDVVSTKNGYTYYSEAEVKTAWKDEWPTSVTEIRVPERKKRLIEMYKKVPDFFFGVGT